MRCVCHLFEEVLLLAGEGVVIFQQRNKNIVQNEKAEMKRKITVIAIFYSEQEDTNKYTEKLINKNIYG